MPGVPETRDAWLLDPRSGSLRWAGVEAGVRDGTLSCSGRAAVWLGLLGMALPKTSGEVPQPPSFSLSLKKDRIVPLPAGRGLSDGTVLSLSSPALSRHQRSC